MKNREVPEIIPGTSLCELIIRVREYFFLYRFS